MSEGVLSDLLGIGGSALIAASIYFAQRAVARSSATLDLLKEYHSQEVSEARSKAHRHVVLALSEGREEWRNSPIDPQTGLSPAESLFVLSRFFARLRVIQRSKMISDSRLLTLFGPGFGFWWGLTYERQMDRTDSFQTRGDLQGLYDFFCLRAISEHRMKQWAAWIEDGRNERLKAETGKHHALPSPRRGRRSTPPPASG